MNVGPHAAEIYMKNKIQKIETETDKITITDQLFPQQVAIGNIYICSFLCILFITCRDSRDLESYI